MAFETFTLRQRPDLEEQVHRLNGESWPTFLVHGDVTHWKSLLDEFADHQILFCEPADKWTGMSFPESGPYVVLGALQPVWIDREQNKGRYEDPNVWMRHPVAG
ncbi:MAG: hypothetical protein M3N00_02395 [Actinomycetota bacterium]|nr:hypothetical protein [Actinomycetota bacterium]